MAAPFVKAASVSKPVVLAPVAYLTILVTAAASVLVKVVTSVPVA